jgi:hypothetical protein
MKPYTTSNPTPEKIMHKKTSPKKPTAKTPKKAAAKKMHVPLALRKVKRIIREGDAAGDASSCKTARDVLESNWSAEILGDPTYIQVDDDRYVKTVLSMRLEVISKRDIENEIGSLKDLELD